jgi:transposase
MIVIYATKLCGPQKKWIRIHDTLEENGIDTILANPYKTKIIAEAKIKSDKLDARILSQVS